MNMKKLLRGPFVWVAVVLLLAYLGAQMLSGDAPAEIDTSEGLELLRGDTVEQVEVNDTTQRVELALSEDFEDVGEIGRASCRERVWISGGAGAGEKEGHEGRAREWRRHRKRRT